MQWDELDPKFKSNAKIAAALHVQWKRASPRDARKVTPPSLATKLGDLRRGKTDWWSRRPELTELLAAMLDCESEDLIGQTAAPIGSLAFPEFPGLPPLRAAEEPCRMLRGGWLRELVLDAIEHPKRRWITADPGAGKSFVVRWLQIHAEDEWVAVSVRTLAGAAEHFADPRPLIVDVDERDPATEDDAVRRLTRRRVATIVLAAHARPAVDAGEAKWDEARVEFTPGARARLIRWIDQRLETSAGDTRLELEPVLELLGREDPEASIVASPADVMAFCADVHAFGLDAATWETRARRWLDSIGRKSLPADAPATWTRLLGPTLDALCTAALTHREHAWGAVPGRVWASYLPDDLRGPEQARVGSRLIVGYLRSAGLLRSDGGGLELSPTWVRHGLATAALDLSIATDPPSRWGLLAADRSRQPLVDAALDRLGDAALGALVRSVVEPRAPRSLGLLAAREAVFAAAARRLAGEEFRVPEADVPAWQRLAQMQISSLSREHDSFLPFTRSDENPFLADAWTMSLRLPAPPEPIDPALMWRFPGWFAELDPTRCPRHWPWSGRKDASRPVRQIATQALEVLPRLRALPDDIALPRVFLPATVLLAPARGWVPTPPTLAPLPGSWEALALLERLEGSAPDEREAVAELLWNGLPRIHAPPGEHIPVALRLARLKNIGPDLLPFIVANLSESALLRTIDTDGIQRHAGDASELTLLPRPLRRLVARTVLMGQTVDTPPWFAARAIARILDHEDLELILELIRSRDAHVAAEFTEFVWRVAPARAREEALRAVESGLPSAWAWYFHAPRQLLAGLVTQLQHAPRPLPDWVPAWAHRRLPDAGPAAEVLFELVGQQS